MSNENLQQRSERICKGAVEAETFEYMGNKVTKEEFQELLDEMDHNERTFALTRTRLGEVLDKLVEESQEHLQTIEAMGKMHVLEEGAQYRMENTKAIYDEYQELLNDDEPGCGENYLDDGVAFWINKSYLETLHRKKKMVNFWKNK